MNQKDAQIGRNLNGADIFTPRVDETPVPCDHYQSSDCVYMSDKTDSGYLGISQQSSLTDFVNELICRMKEQDQMIRSMDNEINKLKIKIDNNGY